jgi:hypothetical protein
VSGCPAAGDGSAGSDGSAGGGGSGGGGSGSPAGGGSAGSPAVTKPSVTGLRTGHASLRFKITIAKHAAKLTALTVELPNGLSFAGHHAGKKLVISGVTLNPAKIKSLTLSHHHLIITLRTAVSSLTVTIKTTALKESAALKAKAKRLKRLPLTVITKNTKGKRTTIHVQITNLAL